MERRLRGSGLVLALVFGLYGLSGCGSDQGALSAAGPGQRVAMRGSVYGGEQPVGGSTVQLYIPGTGGYGSAATPLLSPAVTSDAAGNFNFTFNCPSTSALVYMVASGGNPGLVAGTNNQAIVLMSALGPCETVNGFLSVNELTTVSAVYALAPFMKDWTHIGAPVSNLQGLTNAFKTAGELTTITGHLPGALPAIATAPLAEINTLADALSSCTNSTGLLALSQPCGQLFQSLTPQGGTAPTNLAAATLNLAQNPSLPSRSGHSLIGTLTSTPPFMPTLSTEPSDWTIGINYVTPAFRTPADLAVDALGQVWVLAAPGTLANGSSTVSTLNPATGVVGTYPQQSMNFGNMALDSYNEVWLTNTAASNVVVLSSSGARVNAIGYTGGGLTGPGPLGFDPLGNVWIVNNTATVTELSGGGSPMPNSPFATGGARGPVAISLDKNGSVWTADSAGSSVAQLLSSGLVAPGSPYTLTLNGPSAIAFDALGQVYVANRNNSSLTRISASTSTAFFGAGISAPLSLAIDGNGSVWMANAGSNTVSEVMTATGSLTAVSSVQGFGSASLQNPYKVAIDGSGNVWVANVGSKVAGSGLVTQLVGAAAPVVTPVATAVKNSALGTRP